MPLHDDEAWIDELLQLETRHLAGPDGKRSPYTSFKSFWKAYDFLIYFGTHSHDRIVELSVLNSERTGAPFEDSFEAVVRNANSHAKRILGIDAFSISPALRG